MKGNKRWTDAQSRICWRHQTQINSNPCSWLRRSGRYLLAVLNRICKPRNVSLLHMKFDQMVKTGNSNFLMDRLVHTQSAKYVNHAHAHCIIFLGEIPFRCSDLSISIVQRLKHKNWHTPEFLLWYAVRYLESSTWVRPAHQFYGPVCWNPAPDQTGGTPQQWVRVLVSWTRLFVARHHQVKLQISRNCKQDQTTVKQGPHASLPIQRWQALPTSKVGKWPAHQIPPLIGPYSLSWCCYPQHKVSDS